MMTPHYFHLMRISQRFLLSASAAVSLLLAPIAAQAYECKYKSAYTRATKKCHQLESQGKMAADEDASSCQIYRFRQYTKNAATPDDFMVCLDKMGWLGLPPSSGLIRK